jgi:dTDP-4-dehydrorhamnose 3,5-epimerase
VGGTGCRLEGYRKTHEEKKFMKITAVKSLAIPDIRVVRFARFRDERGYFTESYRMSDFRIHPETGFFRNATFLQGNESYSDRGVIRGLHFQWNPVMGKLVRTVVGHMVDLVLDIRKGSPTFGKIIAYDMPSAVGDGHGEWIWVPPGFAHGNFFLAPTQVEYFCSAEYSPGHEAGISPWSGDLDWSLCDAQLREHFSALAAHGILSDKDRRGLTLDAWSKDPRSDNFIYGRCDNAKGRE